MTQPQREFAVQLPIGMTDDQGVTHRGAVIRKMRGHEEALLYDRDLGPSELASHLVAGTLVRLGELEGPSPEVVAGMYSADRNYLLLEVRRITLGDRLTGSYVCPSCDGEVRTSQDLGDLSFRSLGEVEDPEAIEVELEDGYTDREGNLHRSVTLRLPRGEDEAFVSSMIERDPLKAADALVLRCIRRFGTIPRSELESYGVRILRDLTLGDRLRIQRALTDDAPGARLRRELQCGACGAQFQRLLDVSDFFVPC